MHIGDMLSLCARGVEKDLRISKTARDYAETKCFSGFCAVLTGSVCFGCVHRSYDLRWMFQVSFFLFFAGDFCVVVFGSGFCFVQSVFVGYRLQFLQLESQSGKSHAVSV